MGETSSAQNLSKFVPTGAMAVWKQYGSQADKNANFIMVLLKADLYQYFWAAGQTSVRLEKGFQHERNKKTTPPEEEKKKSRSLLLKRPRNDSRPSYS